MLALLVPAMAVPVSAGTGDSLALYLLNPLGGNPAAPSTSGLAAEGQIGFNITGSQVRVIPVITSNASTTVTGWSLIQYPANNAVATIVASATGNSTTAYADVQGGIGMASIVANLSDGSTVSIDKKWAQIANTVISPNQSIPVMWVEASKSFTATANVTDIVNGIFADKDGNPEPHVIQGVILHWYLIDGNAVSNISLAPGFFHTGANTGVNDVISALPRASFTTFAGGVTTITTVTGLLGTSTVTMTAIGEEPVDVVVVPEYPSTSNVLVTPEITKVNFWTQEMEKVPQVRWAGEKIVLEKNWGDALSTNGTSASVVKFSLENQSPGMLTAVGPGVGNLFNLTNTTQTVWAPIVAGVSSVVLECQDTGVASVTATLYQIGANGQQVMVNQHGFVVYFLKLESLTLGNVSGKRANEDSGLFEPSNPWDTSTDVTAETLNVSTDTLLRARVKGWFTSSNPTTRPAGFIDINNTPNNTTDDLLLPAGRWVLPDDWPMLAGIYNWQEFRLHWDIMDNPSDNVMSKASDPATDNSYPGIATPKTPATYPSTSEEGNYGTGNYYHYSTTFVAGVKVASAPVIGPFSPGLELMTPTGWQVKPLPAGFTSDPRRLMSTVVPNGILDWWDAPMPPAKITFELNNVAFANPAGVAIGNSGFFKTAMKTDIYYVWAGPGKTNKYYTNPFYQEMIPAHEWIPAFINNGGYDWDSFGTTALGSSAAYGPYPFWYIINRLNNAMVPTSNQDYPTKVQVYSDNHGEAMVYLNGDWNLNGNIWTPNGRDIPVGTLVGNSVVQATADYPYYRVHQAVFSNTVTKTWDWAGEVLQTVLSIGDFGNVSGSSPNQIGTSNKKLVLIWATDRDGRIDGAIGTKVEWNLDPSKGVSISTDTTVTILSPLSGGVSSYNDTMKKINVTNGFLDVAPGTVTDGTRFHGISYLMTPSAAEKTLFHKLYPTKDQNAYAVAGIAVIDLSGAAGTFMGTVDTTVQEVLTGGDFDTTTLLYGQNVNFTLPYPLDDNIMFGDSNNDGIVSMADVTATERMILGLSQANVMADANAKDGINMGDVVKIERIILGLN